MTAPRARAVPQPGADQLLDFLQNSPAGDYSWRQVNDMITMLLESPSVTVEMPVETLPEGMVPPGKPIDISAQVKEAVQGALAPGANGRDHDTTPTDPDD